MAITQWDMHVHLDFMRDPGRVASEAETLGLGMFAVTVTPDGYERVRPDLAGAGNVRLGVGLHPWWAADGRCTAEDAAHAAQLARQTRYVGEIGLDASPKHVPEGSLERQAEIFEMICAACAGTSDPGAPKVLSLHTVQAADLTLDILERTGCLAACRCIFHWFTGSGTALSRAVKAGCLFSVNEMMLSTRRGRDYARQIPEKSLLTETDLPPGTDVPYSAGEITGALARTLSELQTVRGRDVRMAVCKNAEKLFF